MNSFSDPHLDLNSKPLALEDYKNIRHSAAKDIEQLGAAAAASLTHPEPQGQQDEAGPFRGRSIDVCIGALDHEDIASRCGAASSLA